MILLHLQAFLNNFTKYSFTNLSSNQILFEFQMHKTLNLICVNKPNIVETAIYSVNIFKTHSAKHIKLVVLDQYRSVYINAKDTIVFAVMQMKQYYNEKHQSHFFKSDNIINLWLHCEYILSDIQNKKLEQQFVESLCIIKRIKHLIYYLNIFTFWWIHNVVSIIYLESVSSAKNNSYNCSWSDHSDVVIMTLNTLK